VPSLLSINNYYYKRGGAEAVFLEQNRMFNNIGWKVVPFSMHHPENLRTEWSRYFVNEIEYGSEYSLLGKIVRAPKIIYSLESRSKIKKILNDYPIDICHIHNIYHHISPSVLSLIKEHNIPVIMTLHDLKIACPAYNMLAIDGICERCKGGRVYNVLLHRCIKGSIALSTIVMLEALLHRMLHTYEKYVDKFVVPSKFYINKLIEWGWDSNRFIHIPNFVHVNHYQPEYNPGHSFLYFGRLSREKGLITLIKASTKANVQLSIVGTGPDEDEIRQLAQETSANVQFLGYLKGEALQNAVRSARAVVLPSEWYENAPMSIIESYALGKPVIGGNIGGIPELIHQDETGYIFTSGSVEDLAKILNKVSTIASGKLARMGRNGRTLVEAEYSEEKYCERMLKVYKQMGVS